MKSNIRGPDTQRGKRVGDFFSGLLQDSHMSHALESAGGECFSDLMVEVFGEHVGKHAHSAVGMQALPSNSAVEVAMIVEIE